MNRNTEESLLLPNLPNDVAIQCIARVPRSFHPLLSQVCRSWKSLLRSPLFFTVRNSLNCTQQVLYINIRNPQTGLSWFSLDLANTKNPRPVALPPIPVSAIGSAYVVLDSKIFVLGGSVNEIPSSNVWIFDTLKNQWISGPKMRVSREFAAAGVINGKIYVIGGCSVDSWTKSKCWAEYFNPKTSSWNPISSPIEIQAKWMHGSAVVGEKIFAMADRGGVVLNPENSSWSNVSKHLDLGWRGRASVVNGILYCYDYLGKIRGFDFEEDKWKILNGVEKDLPRFLCGATMATVEGRLCVAWEGKCRNTVTEIFCAEIEVRMENSGELWGSVIWSDVILELPKASSIILCLGLGL